MRLPPLHIFRSTDVPREHMTKQRNATAALCAALTFALAACEAQKSSNPLSPSVAGPIPGVNITAPKLVEPAQGFKYKESQQPIKLVIENATSNGVRPVTYMFEVATDTDFNGKVYARSGVPAGDGGRTSVQIDRLDLGRAYYWRAKADDGANASQFASAQFEVLPKPLLNPPGLVAPINNERVTSRKPTLTVGESSRNVAIGAVSYEFQVATDQAFTKVVAAGVVQESGGQTTFTPGADLATDLQYFWRGRAGDGETTSAWAATQTFRTPVPVSPGPSPSPSPGNGGSCASNNGPAIVSCVAAKYPGYLVGGISLGQRQANMSFLRDRIIEAGKCGGLDLGQNLKRGGPDLSIDFLAWRKSGGEMGVDLAYDYDNTSTTLRLQWSEAGFGATYKAYPNGSCQ
jgi:hypothetical protein